MACSGADMGLIGHFFIFFRRLRPCKYRALPPRPPESHKMVTRVNRVTQK
jgi:hypothetical protein